MYIYACCGTVNVPRDRQVDKDQSTVLSCSVRTAKILNFCKWSKVALWLLYLAGDLELNPGPSTRSECGICGKTVRKIHHLPNTLCAWSLFTWNVLARSWFLTDFAAYVLHIYLLIILLLIALTRIFYWTQSWRISQKPGASKLRIKMLKLVGKGVVFDQCLTWSEHVKYLVGKVSKRVRLLRRTKNNLSLYTANVIYKSLIFLIIDYCDNVWGCCGKVNSDKLEKLQRRAARIIMKTHRSDDALKFLKYKPLEIRRDQHLLRLVKRCLKKRCPQMFYDYFIFNKDAIERDTRQSNFLRLSSVRLECTKKSFFFYRGSLVYNRYL